MKSKLSGILLLFFCLTSVYAQDKLTWMVLNWPPWMIINDADQEKGRFNHILSVAKKSLSEYEHITEEMNWARFWHEVEDGRDICYIFGVKTRKRQDLVYYSLPHTFLLPNEIIIKKTDLKKFGNPESISIVTLLKDKRIKGYAEKKRSFTEDIDNILKKIEVGSNLERIAEHTESIIRMIITDRIDYTIEYPIVASYYEKKNKYFGVLTSIPITEMKPFTYVYMNCTKNEWGKKVIERWNEELQKIKPTDDYRRITEMGHTDKDELQKIRQYYDEFVNAKN